jgi:hypothetical protein
VTLIQVNLRRPLQQSSASRDHGGTEASQKHSEQAVDLDQSVSARDSNSPQRSEMEVVMMGDLQLRQDVLYELELEPSVNAAHMSVARGRPGPLVMTSVAVR